MDLDQALALLDDVAPSAKLLALGQTALWDEPMKAGIALAASKSGKPRTLVAGVHDTDYFAKLPGEAEGRSGFEALPHNATTTRGLWSAAGEFSSLFGSETVINRQDFLSAGLNLVKVGRGRPGIFDEASAAYGWKGIVALGKDQVVVSELPLAELLPTLRATFLWAIEETLACITGSGKEESLARARDLIAIFDRHAESASAQTLSDFYRILLPDIYAFCAGLDAEGAKLPLETTATSELLRFNLDTYSLPRFKLVERYLHPETRDEAAAAYNSALEGSEIYTLDRFGSGAIPFELVIPGVGRGTLRIGNRALIVMAPVPQFISLKQPLRTLRDLAAAIEHKFGPNCVLTGKAVSLIGMLGHEFVFVFHEGASSYVKHSRRFHALLDQAGIGLPVHPILRMQYEPWDALEGCCSWFKLPEPLARAFGTEEVCSPSFANRWRLVAREQENLLDRLGELRRPMDLVDFLAGHVGGSWDTLAKEYESLHGRLATVRDEVGKLKWERFELYKQAKALRHRRQELEIEKGRHFREKIFEKTPSDQDIEKRRSYGTEIEALIHECAVIRERVHALLREQKRLVQDPSVSRIHERRREIELEAELKRLRLIRSAIIASKGLRKSAHRPSAWWFPLVCPTGHWFKRTVAEARCYLEEMSPKVVVEEADKPRGG